MTTDTARERAIELSRKWGPQSFTQKRIDILATALTEAHKAGRRQGAEREHPCTCDPDERPPVCQHRYASSECQHYYQLSKAPSADQALALAELMQRRPYGTPASVKYDGLRGTVVGWYLTQEGKLGITIQQDGTRVVHIYGEQRVEFGAAPSGEDE